MTRAQARRIFDRAIAATDDPVAIASIELCREYFCNPAFRKLMENISWEQLTDQPKKGQRS